MLDLYNIHCFVLIDEYKPICIDDHKEYRSSIIPVEILLFL